MDIKYLAQRALICYLKSIHNQGDKEVFDASKISVSELAESYGLIGTPTIKFCKKEEIPL